MYTIQLHVLVQCYICWKADISTRTGQKSSPQPKSLSCMELGHMLVSISITIIGHRRKLSRTKTYQLDSGAG